MRAVDDIERCCVVKNLSGVEKRRVEQQELKEKAVTERENPTTLN
jgi:hypothetical protein